MLSALKQGHEGLKVMFEYPQLYLALELGAGAQAEWPHWEVSYSDIFIYVADGIPPGSGQAHGKIVKTTQWV